MDKKEAKIKREFNKITAEESPKPNLLKHCIGAFIVGGLICDVGQFFTNYFMNAGYSKEDTAAIVPIIMVFIGTLLTGLDIYDGIAEYGGGGTVVPITGFANAMASPAIEYKTEGLVFGVAVKMFTIAGPVLVYGIGSSVVAGLIFWLFSLFH